MFSGKGQQAQRAKHTLDIASVSPCARTFVAESDCSLWSCGLSCFWTKISVYAFLNSFLRETPHPNVYLKPEHVFFSWEGMGALAHRMRERGSE